MDRLEKRETQEIVDERAKQLRRVYGVGAVIAVLIFAQFCLNATISWRTSAQVEDVKTQLQLAEVDRLRSMETDIKSLLFANMTLSVRMANQGIRTGDVTQQMKAMMAKYEEPPQ